MTRRQSNNDCSGGISAHPDPKNFECKNPLEKFSSWDQDGILFINYLPKGQTINAGYDSSLLVQLKDILRGKRRGKSPRGSCSFTTMPRLTRHLQPRRNWPTWASSVLITQLPTDYHLFPGLRKARERSPFFVRRGGHCCRTDLVGWTNF